MGIVYDGRVLSILRTYRFEASAHAFQGAHDHKNFFRLLSEHDGGAVYSQQIAYVELADELHTYLVVVNLEIHAFEMAFYYPGLEVGHAACRVCLDPGLGVLDHEHAVLVVGVGYGESVFGESVEERLFRVTVVLEGLVIVQMVACKVGKQASGKLQAAYSFLCDGVA